MGPHGEFQLSLEGCFITSTLSGCFNEKGAYAYTHALRALIESLNGARFVILINNLNVEGGTPEAFDILDLHNQWVSEQNIVAKAIVCHSQALIHIMMSRVPSVKQQNLAMFTSLSEAKIWLHSFLSSAE